MKLSNLRIGDVVKCRMGRSCSRHPIEWEEWQDKPIYGIVINITVNGTAEYDPNHDYIPSQEGYPNGFLQCEDWLLEIEGLEYDEKW